MVMIRLMFTLVQFFQQNEQINRKEENLKLFYKNTFLENAGPWLE